jgi:hypothetical protein
MGVSGGEMQQMDRIKSFAINGAPYESRTRLFRLKSRVDANDSNGYFDSSCNVPGMEDQRLRSESKRGLMLNLTPARGVVSSSDGRLGRNDDLEAGKLTLISVRRLGARRQLLRE